MTRTLYRGLLWLHPPSFRREFSGEMLWIFEETSPDGVAPLFADGVISLLRQWLLRSGPWKLAAALIGGLLEIVAGGLGGAIFMHTRMQARMVGAPLHRISNPAEAIALQNLVPVMMWVSVGTVLMVVATVAWVRGINRKRLDGLARGVRANPARLAQTGR
ncbi:MAG TPA: hypothetical protein VMH81_36370 [Bryobacteraceae bacterium]|nr:hypothetical protein [Bryobacteraceae bacterium]